MITRYNAQQDEGVLASSREFSFFMAPDRLGKYVLFSDYERHVASLEDELKAECFDHAATLRKLRKLEQQMDILKNTQEKDR